MVKKAIFNLILAVAACVLVYFTHLRETPLYEWTRIPIIFPIILAGVHFRREGSVGLSLLVFMCLMPVLFVQYGRHSEWGLNFFISMLALLGTGIYLGHILRKEIEDSDTLNKMQGALENERKDAEEEQVYQALENAFRDRTKAGLVETCIFNGEGNLVKRGAPGAPPLPPGHMFYQVARSGQFFSSNFSPNDRRVKFTGPASDRGNILQMAAFPIEYGGRVRGVIAVANCGEAGFGREAVSFLTAIKKSFEHSLEILEKRREAIGHEIQRRRIRDTFSSYVSRTVAEEILKDPERLHLGGRLSHVSVMFTEIVNFESLLDTLEAGDLLDTLNRFFSLAIDTVFEHDGTLDKFIGDNVMAFWGAPLPMPDGELKAVQCAMALQKRISELNKSLEEQGRAALNVCIGINSGPVVAGNIGSIRRMEYTVIGDTVNTAARIKSLSKTNGAPILISENTYRKVSSKFNFENTYRAALKGKTGETTVYQLETQ